MDRNDVHDELERARLDFADLVEQLTPKDLHQRSRGTRWTNRQLLFHMVFGYLIVRTLLPLVHLLGRLGWSRRFASTLNAVHRPFHLINYLGSVGGGQLLTPPDMVRLLNRTIQILHRRLTNESDADLALAMHFPTAWDPYFQTTMTVADLYHYGTQHFDHHKRQLMI
jgi:hypothetical protein